MSPHLISIELCVALADHLLPDKLLQCHVLAGRPILHVCYAFLFIVKKKERFYIFA